MNRILVATLLLAAVFSFPQQLNARRTNELVEIRPSVKHPSTTFVIFADIQTYNACKNEIGEYRKALEKEGLGTFIYASDWKRPEQVKGYIYSVNADVAPLEGVLFVGNVPQVKVKGAGHLASEPSCFNAEDCILSDRFYDDFNLNFIFCGNDPSDGSFVYELSSRGRQDISCDIYSSRIYLQAGQESDQYEAVKKTISSWAIAHISQKIDAEKIMRKGNVGKWTCSLDTFLEGDQTEALPSDSETTEITSIYKMTEDALASKGNCSAELLEIIKESNSVSVRKSALDCLAKFADDNCAMAVEAALDDPDETIRCSAARYAALMGICPERAAACSLQHERVPEMVQEVLDEEQTLEQRIATARELGNYYMSYNRDKITEGLSVALSRKFLCPQPLREEILKTLRRIR